VDQAGEEIEEIIMQALCHETRRRILRIVGSGEKGASYTVLMNELGLPSGSLNYHLGQLEGLVERNKEQRYTLTPVGKRALNLLDSITADTSPDFEKYVKIARVARKGSWPPPARNFVYICILGVSAGTLVTAVLICLAVSEGASIAISGSLALVFLLEVLVLSLLIYALRVAPSLIGRFEKRVS